MSQQKGVDQSSNFQQQFVKQPQQFKQTQSVVRGTPLVPGLQYNQYMDTKPEQLLLLKEKCENKVTQFVQQIQLRVKGGLLKMPKEQQEELQKARKENGKDINNWIKRIGIASSALAVVTEYGFWGAAFGGDVQGKDFKQAFEGDVLNKALAPLDDVLLILVACIVLAAISHLINAAVNNPKLQQCLDEREMKNLLKQFQDPEIPLQQRIQIAQQIQGRLENDGHLNEANNMRQAVEQLRVVQQISQQQQNLQNELKVQQQEQKQEQINVFREQNTEIQELRQQNNSVQQQLMQSKTIIQQYSQKQQEQMQTIEDLQQQVDQSEYSPHQKPHESQVRQSQNNVSKQQAIQIQKVDGNDIKASQIVEALNKNSKNPPQL